MFILKIIYIAENFQWNLDEMTGLTLSQKIGYGSGHVLNDICYCLWSTYVLLFFHEVIHFNNNYAGYVELLGQLADGFSIILVGVWGERPGFTFRLCRTRGQGEEAMASVGKFNIS